MLYFLLLFVRFVISFVYFMVYCFELVLFVGVLCFVIVWIADLNVGGLVICLFA